MTPFWWTWPSWDVELSVGALGAIAAIAVAGGNVPAAAWLCAVGSLLYEFHADPNRGKPGHRPWRDVGQRACGSAIAIAVYAFAR